VKIETLQETTAINTSSVEMLQFSFTRTNQSFQTSGQPLKCAQEFATTTLSMLKSIMLLQRLRNIFQSFEKEYISFFESDHKNPA